MRREDRAAYHEFLVSLANESGIATPTRAELQLSSRTLTTWVADNGYHSNETMRMAAELGLTSDISEPDRDRRRWKNEALAGRGTHENRRRIRGERGELLERSCAHMLETGGMRKVHLRGRLNVLERCLVHVAALNSGILMRSIFGVGTPKGLQGRVAVFRAALDELMARIFALLARRTPIGPTSSPNFEISAAGRLRASPAAFSPGCWATAVLDRRRAAISRNPCPTTGRIAFFPRSPMAQPRPAVPTWARDARAVALRKDSFMRPTILSISLLALLASLAPAQNCTPPPDGLIAWWDADETFVLPIGYVLAMDIGQRVSGVPMDVSSATLVPGHVGLGLRFSTNQLAEAKPDPRFDLTSAMTVELWFHANYVPLGPITLLGKCVPTGWFTAQDGYLLFADFATGKATFRIGHGSSASTVTTTSTVIDGTWRHIAATFDASLGSGNMAIYVDGVLEATTNTSAPIAVNTVPVHTGTNFGARTLDALSLYDRALTPAEIARIAQADEKCSERYPTRMYSSSQIVVPNLPQAAGSSIATDGEWLATRFQGAQNPGPFDGGNGIAIFRRDANGDWQFVQSIMNDIPLYTSPWGSTLSISGDAMAVGVNGLESSGSDLAIYRFNASSSPQWQLEYSDPVPGGGDSVAVHNDVAIVGKASLNGGDAYARIYRYSGGSWAVEAQLSVSSADAWFGRAVDIGDDLAVVGAQLEDVAGFGADCGALYVYRRVAGTWSLVQTITPDMVNSTPLPSYAGWKFGAQVDLDGERVLVSAPYAPLQGAAVGKAFVIDLSGGGVNVEGELRPSGNSTSAWYGNGFGLMEPFFTIERGRNVHLVGDRAIVGAQKDVDDHFYDLGGFRKGAVYVFARRNGQWGEVGKCATGVAVFNYNTLGASAVISGDEVISGQEGDKLYVFDGFEHADLPTSYCTSSTSSSGCNARIWTAGQARVSGSKDMLISVDNVEGQRSGLIFYSLSGRKAGVWAPGNTSVLCVKSPVQRTGTKFSGGTNGACDGHIGISWRDYLASHPAAQGQPFTPGVVVDAQCWFRDPAAPGTTNLSDAVEFATYP